MESLDKKLCEFISDAEKIAIICLGNELRGDDAAGKIVCSLLNRLIDADKRIYIEYVANDSSRILGLALNGYKVIVVDAVYAEGLDKGTIIVIEPESESVLDAYPSSHKLGLALMSRYAVGKTILVGINIAPNPRLGIGETISDNVANSARKTATMLANIIRECFL